MLTSTLSLAWSALISEIVPLKSAKGPDVIRTTSPSSKPRRTAGLCSSFLTTRIFSISRRDSGVGFCPVPADTNPVTPGVLRTTYQESLSYSIFTSR